MIHPVYINMWTDGGFEFPVTWNWKMHRIAILGILSIFVKLPKIS